MHIRWLSDTARGEGALTGGKAANLGELIRLGMPVPRGFVVTTSAYAAQAERWGLAGTLSSLLARQDWVGVEEAARALLVSRPMDEPLQSIVLEAYHQMGSPAVAVRSSATAEDLADASFAGQHDTFLNVRGADELLQAVGKCWASLWSQRAVLYRQERSIDHLSTRMAVIIQEMAPSEAGGVVFTVDPVAQRSDRIRVEIAPGLGEAVVSGAVSGEVYRIDRSTLTIAESHGDHMLLEAEGAAELCRLALQIERHYGCPQDIEFAVAGGKLYILQARPITTLGDELPEPLPPIGKPSLVDRTMRPLAAERYVIAPRPLDNFTFTRMVGAAIYVVRQDGGRISAEDEAAFRAQVWRQAYRLPPVQLTWQVLFSGLRSLHLLSTDWQAWWESGPRDTLLAVSAPVDLTVLSDEELLERADRILAAWEEPLNRRFLAASAIRAERWLNLMVALVVSRQQRAQVVANLMPGLQIPTNEVNEALWQLSRLARRDPSLRAAVHDLKPEGVPSTPEGRAFRDAFRSFIDRYGHREGTCYYLSTPTWRRDPMQVWRLLSSMVEVETRSGDAENALARYEAARALVERRLRFFPWLRSQFGRIVDRLRALNAFRESSHFDITLPLAALQDIAAEWGRRLVERRILGTVDDVYYLTHDEVRSWLLDATSRPTDARQLLARRRATYKVINSRWQAERLGGSARVSELKGIGVSPGVARGRARVIHGEHEFDRLQPGEVLVCPYSNPAWTPLFISAAAVVAETGGVASHAAIVAREYGIPAVMSVHGVTQSLQDGQEVIVDGERGIVLRPRVGRDAAG